MGRQEQVELFAKVTKLIADAKAYPTPRREPVRFDRNARLI